MNLILTLATDFLAGLGVVTIIGLCVAVIAAREYCVRHDWVI